MEAYRVINITQLYNALRRAIEASVKDTAHTKDEAYGGEPQPHAGELPVIFCCSTDGTPHHIGRIVYLPAQDGNEASFTMYEVDADHSPMTGSTLFHGIEEMSQLTPLSEWDGRTRPVISGTFNVNVRCVALVNGHIVLAEFPSQIPSEQSPLQ